jgi:hypothetical protein
MQLICLALPCDLKHKSAPRWAQRFSKPVMLPSRSRATTTGAAPTNVVA